MHFTRMIAAAGLIALAAPASANVITFETPAAGFFSGPVTENGFTYRRFTAFGGGLLVDTFGNPGQDMEGSVVDGGGLLVIKRADGGTFTFDQLDYAAIDSTGIGDQTLLIGGGIHNTLVALELFTLPSTSTYNWTTETASMLAGATIDELFVILDGSATAGLNFYYQAIDNVVLTPSGPIPEPATLALFGAGLAGFAARRRIAKKN